MIEQHVPEEPMLTPEESDVEMSGTNAQQEEGPAITSTDTHGERPPEDGHRASFWPVILHMLHDRSTGSTNDSLVEHLKASGSVKEDQIERAFRAVDRALFMPGMLGSAVYDDAPVRSGNFHMSQPSLYAEAIEALQLEPGVSFLNIGAGTGYLSSIVSHIVGRALHHGVDVHEDVQDHASRMFRANGDDHIQFFQVNAHDIDLDRSPYQRIYVGACVGEESKHILQLLEIGGIMVGPFETAYGQFIRQIVRRSTSSFEVSNLKSVQFGRLVPSTSSEMKHKFALPAPVWSPETHARHSEAFRKALTEVLFCTTRRDSPAHILPREIWVKHIFCFLHPRWFDEPNDNLGMQMKARESDQEMGIETEIDEDLLHMRSLHALGFLAHHPGMIGDPSFVRLMMLLRSRQARSAEEDSDAEENPEENHSGLHSEDANSSSHGSGSVGSTGGIMNSGSYEG